MPQLPLRREENPKSSTPLEEDSHVDSTSSHIPFQRLAIQFSPLPCEWVLLPFDKYIVDIVPI